jgi:hypothetical protein
MLVSLEQVVPVTVHIMGANVILENTERIHHHTHAQLVPLVGIKTLVTLTPVAHVPLGNMPVRTVLQIVMTVPRQQILR